MKYKLFLDLDGVLVDFAKGVFKATGKMLGEISEKEMWTVLAKTPNFFTNLDWMPDGKELWNYSKKYNPVILTGLPLGNWAEKQKRQWCKRELGDNVEVITCMTKEKSQRAIEVTNSDEIPVIIDDRIKLKEEWESMGGIFIFHISASSSIAKLKEIGL